MHFLITNIADAKKALEHFNGFHDGFFKRMEIVSRQTLTPEGHVSCSAVFDLVLEIAHHNYGPRRAPFNRMVRCVFQEVQGICLDFKEAGECAWSIDALDIREAGEAMLCMLQRPHLQGRVWVTRQHDLFQFRSAEFSEEVSDNIIADPAWNA